MILTDREIQAAISSRQIEISPLPPPEAYSSTSVDLTLSNTFSEWDVAPGMVIKPGAKEYKYASVSRHQKKIISDDFTLKPKSFVLGWTNEEIKIHSHSRLAARVEGKSSLARLGVGIHVTAPTIHCGFQGFVQLEIFNFSSIEIVLSSQMKICQLIFELTLGTPEKGYSGMFLNQDTNFGT